MANLTPISLEQLIDQLDKLVSLPNVYYRLDALIQNPSSSVDDFAKLLGADTDLCARLLTIANSAFYSLPMTVDTVPKAISIIGTRQIRELVLVTSVMNVFKGNDLNGMSMDSFWRHSVAVGVIAKYIAKTLNMPQADKAYVPGLLHDLGRLALYISCNDTMLSLEQQKQQQGVSLTQLENEFFGYNHADVGGGLLIKWQVPQSIVEPVMMHHNPRLADEFYMMTCVIALADTIAIQQGFCSGSTVKVDQQQHDMLEELHINEQQLDTIWQQAEQEIKQVSRQFLKH